MTRLRRRLGTFARTRSGTFVLAALACVAVVLAGLLAEGYLSPAAPAADFPDATPTGELTLGPSVVVTQPASGAGGSESVSSIGKLKKQLPGPVTGAHRVTLEVHSARPVATVGYLVPRGLSRPSGTAHPHARHWSMTQQAVGSGPLAEIFLQAGPNGVPITCAVVVDGKVRNRATTAGAYGRAVCIG